MELGFLAYSSEGPSLNQCVVVTPTQPQRAIQMDKDQRNSCMSISACLTILKNVQEISREMMELSNINIEGTPMKNHGNIK